MKRTLVALWAVVTAAALAACAGTGSGGKTMIPQTVSFGDNLVADVKLPHDTVGEELPSEGIGALKDHPWGEVGGFTQSHYAQVLAFPPGTELTIRNLSKSTPHTFDVVALARKAPAHFPAGAPSVNANGDGELKVGYASGPIQPGHSVKLKLVKEGTYLIECAFHYAEGMQDVIVVKAGAKPGPEATPQGGTGSSPSPMPTSTGGGGGGW